MSVGLTPLPPAAGPAPNSGVAPRPVNSGELTISAYDRFSGMLIALLMIVGITVVSLFIIWLTTVITWSTPAVPVEIVDPPAAGRGDHAEGFARDAEAPGEQELEEVMTQPQIQETLQAVSNVVTQNLAMIDSLDTNAVSTNKGSGKGDSRPPGPLGEGEDIVPRWDRWVIRYESNNPKIYAAQLDFFGVELGAVDLKSPNVEFAKNLAKGRPDKSSSTRDQENARNRLSFSWQDGALKDLDRQLLSKAGVAVSNKILYQFFPKATENQLAALELNHAKRPVQQIKRTVFAIKTQGAKYEFFVAEQQYRVPRSVK